MAASAVRKDAHTCTRAHHLEPERAVDHEEDEVGDLADVDHRVQVVRALDDRQPPALARDDGDGPAEIRDGLLRVAPDEAPHERALSHARRADDGDDDRRRRVERRAVHERDVQPRLVALGRAPALDVRAPARARREGLWARAV
jgi:hypothetical protein